MTDAIDEINAKHEHTVKTYYELIKSDIKYDPAMKFSDRHNFFKKLNPELKKSVKEVLFSGDSEIEKVTQIVRLIGMKYETSEVDSVVHGKKILFELLGDYDTVIIAPRHEIFKSVVSYFSFMFN